MKYVFCLLLLFIAVTAKADDWFCKTQSMRKSGNIVQTCGIGVALYSEEAARLQSMRMAKYRFQELCLMDASCYKLKNISAEPKRMDCETVRNLTTCYQLLEFTLE